MTHQEYVNNYRANCVNRFLENDRRLRELEEARKATETPKRDPWINFYRPRDW